MNRQNIILHIERMVLTIICSLALSAKGYTLLSSNQLVFVNVDHAPIGACSTFLYGNKSSECGFGFSSSSAPYSSGGGGVVIVLVGNGVVHALPFVSSAANISSTATFFADANVQRTLTPSTDGWNVNGGALNWTNYTPAWKMTSFDSATLAYKKIFFLPATWMVFTINNTNSYAEDFYFGLPVSVTQTSYAGGAYQGFATGEGALAVQTGSCDLLTGTALKSALNGMSSGGVFHLNIPAGQTKSLTVVMAFYRSAVTDPRINAHYYYTSLYSSMDNVIAEAFSELGDAQMRCQQLASAMAGAQLNSYRQFLASDALHSYMACTKAELDATNNFFWREMEGGYSYINTFDLTVDHSFYDLLMYPWALRNVLDTYSGTFNGSGYSYTHSLYDTVANVIVSPNGFGFHHDMGQGFTSSSPSTDPSSYESTFTYMGQEELQNWILCAGLYWKHTGDDVWLTNNTAILQSCLNSMLLRDDTNAATRDGVTTYLNERGTTQEITTYDALDSSLKSPRLNAMTTVKNWASYLALQAMFKQIGDTVDATTCSNMAGLAAQSIVNAWNNYHGTLGYIPAFLDGSNQTPLLPIVEGLVYPAQMGLTNAMDPVNGPYAAMFQALSNHVTAVLAPGRCLDVTTGSWKLSGSSANTWQSKIYLGQYIVENILGIDNNNVDGTIDQVHATLQFQESTNQGWSDQLDSAGGSLHGSVHYPRGVTSALWWLNATNNPDYPAPATVPATPTGVSATANYQQIALSWNPSSIATGYAIGRSMQSGGPYAPIARADTHTNFTDVVLTNGVTYYYVVTATNQAGSSSPSSEVNGTPYTPSPVGLAAIAGYKTVNLNWPVSTGATGYSVLRTLVSGGPYSIIASNIIVTTLTDANVANGFTYYYVFTVTGPNGVLFGTSPEASATPLISIPLYAVNCGGSTVGGFSADAFYTTGIAYSRTSTINTNGVSNPAPASVYQTERYSDSSQTVTYVFTNLVPDNNYLVRLHFAEIYFSSSGQRAFNVLINGNQVLTNFDIYAIAGAANKAVVRQFVLPANANGQFTIVATNVVQNAQFNGIQIMDVSAFATPATNVNALVSGGNFTLSWPPNYVGWYLQTNTLNIGNSADWGAVLGSQSGHQTTFSMGASNEFFRLYHP
jgi:hypothetical protein